MDNNTIDIDIGNFMKWEAFNIGSSSSREEANITDISMPFRSNISEDDRAKFYGSIFIQDWRSFMDDTDNMAAIGEFVFFNESEILKGKREHITLKNYLRFDVDTVPELMISDLFDKDNINNLLWTCYVEIFIACPEAPNNCVEQFFFNNIRDIIQYFFKIDVRCFVIFPRVFEPAHDGAWIGSSHDDDWIESHDEDGEKFKRMISLLKKAGFRNGNGTGYYWMFSNQKK